MPQTFLVLIVDDDPSLAELAAAFVRADGHDVLFAHDGATALELVSLRMPQAVLLDVGLPDMSGLDVCRRIKNNQATKHIPVIMLSAASTALVETNAIKIGAFAFLAKPYEPADLIATLRRSMGI